MATGDDENSTELQVRWLDPVESREDLPLSGVREGFLCIVTAEQTVYEYRQGNWHREVLMDTNL